MTARYPECNHKGVHAAHCRAGIDESKPMRPETSAERFANTPIPGRADADIRPTGERYYPPDRPLPNTVFGSLYDDPEQPGRDAAAVDLGPDIHKPTPTCPVCDADLPNEKHVGCSKAWSINDLTPGDLLPAPSLPTSALARKELPLATGLLDYFPAALVAVAGLSRVGNEQHNPGKPLAWDRAKSGDEADALLRHFLDRGLIDTDGLRHSTKVAWRALALLQKELEEAGLAPLSRGSR